MTNTRILRKCVVSIIAALAMTLLLAFPAYALEPFLNVGLAKYTGVSSAKIESAAVNVYIDPYSPPVYSFESASGFTLAASGGGVSLTRDGELLCVSDGTMLLQGMDGTTKLGSISYRGFLKPIARGSGITVVNFIDVEHYLYGVVPGEMPASWSLEALKAQAVAARSYAYTQAGVHSESGFDICDTTCCQYYPGMLMEAEGSTNAVNRTAGMLAYYNGEPINAVFCSSSGGHTENSENVWTEALGYLRGVKETHENEYATWTRTYTLEALGNGLAAKGINVGSLTSVTAEYLPSGRVGKLTFSGTGGTQTVRGDAVRGITSEMGGSLPSTLFKINGYCWSYGGMWDSASVTSGGGDMLYVQGTGGMVMKSVSDIYAESAQSGAKKASGMVSAQGVAETKSYGGAQVSSVEVPVGAQNTFTVTSGTVTLEGRGNGHGVGMSQFGAKGLAEAGYDFVHILKHYFTGIEVY